MTIVLLGWLFWQHFHGGVPSHHILHNEDFPKISNWWGALLLPLLTWLLLSRIEKRIPSQDAVKKAFKEPITRIVGLFFLGVVIGLALSVSFSVEFKFFLDNVLFILLGLSLLVPIHYSEFILGFVIAMFYTFGVILPTAFILIFAGIGFLLFRFVRPIILKLFRTLIRS